MDTKYCKFCDKEHPLTKEFWFSLSSSPQCKSYLKSWRRNKPIDKKKADVETTRRWRKQNPEKAKEYGRSYYEKNKKKIMGRNARYVTERKKKDPAFRLLINLRARVSKIIRGEIKCGSSVKDLGCTGLQLKTYIESLWLEGMSWDNYGPSGWHIDHKLPLSKFDLSNKDVFLQLMHYTNLQPMWAKDNIKKGNKL